jgi:hypothetical protein
MAGFPSHQVRPPGRVIDGAFVSNGTTSALPMLDTEQGGLVHHRGIQFTAEFCDFIRDMLQTNPEERPSVLDALEFTEELLNDQMQR